jgi:stage V sporulation protein B
LFPLTSELWARSSKDELRDLLRHALRLSFALLLLPVLVLIAFPETVISLLFTQKFLPAAGILRIMAIVPIFYVPWLYLGSVLGGIGKPGRASMAVAAVAALKMLLDFLLVPIYGMKGAATSTVACYLSGFIIVLLEVRREVNIQIPWGAIMKSLLGAGLTLLLIGFLKAQLTLPLLWKTVCVLGPALACYMFWEMIMGALSIDDLRMLEDAFF